MKFTKDQAFESLKGILTNNGKKTLRMSEKSINKQLDSLMPLIANEEMELDDFVSKVKDTFSVMNSNAEKDNSDFIKQWEKEHPVTEPPKPNEKDGGGEKDEMIQKLMQRMEELEKRNEERTKAEKISLKRKELEEAMEKKGIKDKTWRRDFIAEIQISEDMDVDEKADSFLKIYNRSKASETDDSYSPATGEPSKQNKDAARFKYITDMYERENKRNENQ